MMVQPFQYDDHKSDYRSTGIDRELTDEERRWFDAEIKRAVKHSRAKK